MQASLSAAGFHHIVHAAVPAEACKHHYKPYTGHSSRSICLPVAATRQGQSPEPSDGNALSKASNPGTASSKFSAGRQKAADRSRQTSRQDAAQSHQDQPAHRARRARSEFENSDVDQIDKITRNTEPSNDNREESPTNDSTNTNSSQAKGAAPKRSNKFKRQGSPGKPKLGSAALAAKWQHLLQAQTLAGSPAPSEPLSAAHSTSYTFSTQNADGLQDAETGITAQGSGPQTMNTQASLADIQEAQPQAAIDAREQTVAARQLMPVTTDPQEPAADGASSKSGGTMPDSNAASTDELVATGIQPPSMIPAASRIQRQPGEDYSPGVQNDSIPTANSANSTAGDKAQPQTSVPIAKLRSMYPWVFNSTKLGAHEKAEYAELLYQSQHILMSNDISSLEGRAAPLDRNPAVIEPSLSARVQARWESEQRTYRFFPQAQHDANGDEVGINVDVAAVEKLLQSHNKYDLLFNPSWPTHENGWVQTLQQHSAHLVYMRELHRVLVPQTTSSQLSVQNQETASRQGAGNADRQDGKRKKSKSRDTKQQEATGLVQSEPVQKQPSISAQTAHATFPLDDQMAYQIGVCEHWLQCRNVLVTFSDQFGPAACTAMYRQLCTLITRSTIKAFSPSERHAFSLFLIQLAQRSQQLVAHMSPYSTCWIVYAIAKLEQLLEGRPMSDTLTLLSDSFSFGVPGRDARVGMPARLPKEATEAGVAVETVGTNDDRNTNAHWDGVSFTAARIQAMHSLVSSLCKRAELLLKPARNSTSQDTTPLPTAGNSKTPRSSMSKSSKSNSQPATDRSPAVQEVDTPDLDTDPEQATANAVSSESLWQATQYSQLMWGLGTLGFRPAPSLIHKVIRQTENRLERFQPPQLWAILWGIARLRASPNALGSDLVHIPTSWILRYYGACERIIGDFDATGIVHMTWSIAALRLQDTPPSKQLLRAMCGAAVGRLRSMPPALIVTFVEALTVLGYAPRKEVGSLLLGYARRCMPLMTSCHMCTLIRAVATLPGWQPSKQFMYDWVHHVGRKLRSFTPAEAAGVMWAFAQLESVPPAELWRSLLLRVALRGFTAATPTELSQALWATAKLDLKGCLHGLHVEPPDMYLQVSGRIVTTSVTVTTAPAAQSHQNQNTANTAKGKTSTTQQQSGTQGTRMDVTTSSRGIIDETKPEIKKGLGAKAVASLPQRLSWQAAWVAAVGRAAHTFSAPDLAHVFWAMGQLGVKPPVNIMAALLQQARNLFSEMTMSEMSETVSGLAEMQYRPPDEWLTEFTQQAGPRLPECQGEDIGQLMWGLATLGAPLTDEWLQTVAREARRTWSQASCDGMGLLVWSFAQYSYSPYSEQTSIPPYPAGSSSTGTNQAPGVHSDVNNNGDQARPSKWEAAWWSSFYEACGNKWVNASARGLVLMLLGVAGLVNQPPHREWQVEMLRALRMKLPKPSSSEQFLPLLLSHAGLYVTDTTITKPGKSGNKATGSRYQAEANTQVNRLQTMESLKPTGSHAEAPQERSRAPSEGGLEEPGIDEFEWEEGEWDEGLEFIEQEVDKGLDTVDGRHNHDGRERNTGNDHSKSDSSTLEQDDNQLPRLVPKLQELDYDSSSPTSTLEWAKQELQQLEEIAAGGRPGKVVPDLFTVLQAQGLLGAQPSLQVLIPEKALTSAWLAVLLDELHMRWRLP